MATLQDVSQSVITGAMGQVQDQVKALIADGKKPLEIINDGLIAGMNVVGARFKVGDMFVPEVLMSAKTMAAGVELVKPLIADNDMPNKATVLIGTVKGDLHDIGKNLVSMMIESSGFKVINMGIDIAPEKFIEAIREYKPQIVGLSALLTTTMPFMKETIELIAEEGLKDQVKIMVGGAPISQEYADSIGADGFAPDAASAVDLCNKLAG